MSGFTFFSTQIGRCGIAWSRDTIIATSLPAESDDEIVSRLNPQNETKQSDPPSFVSEVIEAISALLSGAPSDLGFVRCDFGRADSFAVQVYDLTRAIKAGETRTYGEIAKELGDIAFSRRVGQALGRNPIPIIVPCHRVMGADGRLTGFSAPGGTDTKLKLLEIERASQGPTDGLFDHLPLAVKPSD